MDQKLISFDLYGDFGVFKKPDVNDGLQLTYNLLHKPALLGILGAIAGLKGYQQYGILPEYYQKLRQLKVAIQPLAGWHEKGNFAKTVIKYTNTVGYANDDGGTLIVTEQTLRKPAYRCYLMLNLHDETQSLIENRLFKNEAEYLPYFGKNECVTWWDCKDVKTYSFELFKPTSEFKIDSVFVKDISIRDRRVERPRLSFTMRKEIVSATFAYFERLPIDFFIGDSQTTTQIDMFDETELFPPIQTKPLKFVQYELAEFAFTDWFLKPDSELPGLYKVDTTKSESSIIQLF